jgi:hypothetical protein
MLRVKIRGILSLVLAVALATGLVAHGIGNTDAGMKPSVIALAGDMPMSGDCNGCGGDHKSMPTACSAFCGTVVTLPATATLLDMIAIDILRPSAGQDATGYIGPPDPYPPRPIGMS